MTVVQWRKIYVITKHMRSVHTHLIQYSASLLDFPYKIKSDKWMLKKKPQTSFPFCPFVSGVLQCIRCPKNQQSQKASKLNHNKWNSFMHIYVDARWCWCCSSKNEMNVSHVNRFIGFSCWKENDWFIFTESNEENKCVNYSIRIHGHTCIPSLTKGPCVASDRSLNA